MSMPEIEAWQTWKVTMDCDVIRVALHILDPNASIVLRFGEIDRLTTQTLACEEEMVAKIESLAEDVWWSYQARERRRIWMKKHFS